MIRRPPRSTLFPYPTLSRSLDLAAATPITVGTAVLGTLDPASETDLYRFDATVGERALFHTHARNAPPSARCRLLDPISNPVVPERDFNSTGSDSGTVTLSVAGTYTILVEGRFFESGVGSYAFNVRPVSDEAFGLTVGALVTGAIDETGERDVYSFTLARAARVYFENFTTHGKNPRHRQMSAGGLLLQKNITHLGPT